MPQSTISSKTKHIYYSDMSDEAGNRPKFMTGVIVLGTDTGTTATMNPNFTADIPTLEGALIQGEDGYVCQYEYSTADIKILIQGTASEASTALTATTNDDKLNNLRLVYFAWGY